MGVFSTAATERRAFAGSVAIRSTTTTCLMVLGAAGVMALAAQVRVYLPGTPVPMTLQSLAVLLVGFSLPPVAAAVAMVLYLAAGAAGAPVFASSVGLAGITGGYLLGLPFAACVTSILRGAGAASFFRLVVSGLCGLVVLFAFGVGWASVQLGGLDGAAKAGLLPFLPKAVGELVLSAALVRVFRRTRSAGRPGLGGFLR